LRPLTEAHCAIRSLTAMVGDHAHRSRDAFEAIRTRLRKRFHSKCIFNGNPITQGLEFAFRDNGALTAIFTLGPQHMGYDGVAHGGVIAAIIDASMAQCLMGHGIVGYTIELNVKYRKSLRIGSVARLETVILGKEIGILHSLRTEIRQGHNLVVNATGRFCQTDRHAARDC